MGRQGSLGPLLDPSLSPLGALLDPSWAPLGPLLGGVLGPMLRHFGYIFGSFSWNVLDITSGPLLGAILGPTWSRNGGQDPPGTALETKPDAKQRKCKKRTTLLRFCSILDPNLGPKSHPRGSKTRLENDLKCKTQNVPQNAPIWAQLGPRSRFQNAPRRVQNAQQERLNL